MGDVGALGDEGEEALERLALLGVVAALEERGDAHVVGVIVEVGVGADAEHEGRCLGEALRRGPELGKHPVIRVRVFVGEESIRRWRGRRRRSGG